MQVMKEYKKFFSFTKQLIKDKKILFLNVILFKKNTIRKLQ